MNQNKIHILWRYKKAKRPKNSSIGDIITLQWIKIDKLGGMHSRLGNFE